MRAEEFPALWDALDDLPVISPSPVFDAVAACAYCRRTCAPQLLGLAAFAEAGIRPQPALVVISIWMSSMPQVATAHQAAMSRVSAEADFTHDPGFAGAGELRRAFQVRCAFRAARFAGCRELKKTDGRSPVMKLRFQFGAVLAAFLTAGLVCCAPASLAKRRVQ